MVDSPSFYRSLFAGANYDWKKGNCKGLSRINFYADVPCQFILCKLIFPLFSFACVGLENGLSGGRVRTSVARVGAGTCLFNSPYEKGSGLNFLFLRSEFFVEFFWAFLTIKFDKAYRKTTQMKY